ncbi:hypothetical protein LUX01_12565 [Streptomyces sudanensis]|uniref:hypothetical protein n=1 Tax=Streptomyces sudanensis TaxID=436397 RepID=UPI0020CE277E|nr:hypothetical protein [Streptomyces sudanensis]MCP9987402.1 hypothetical protein [Streptomyces sudanensis]
MSTRRRFTCFSLVLALAVGGVTIGNANAGPVDAPRSAAADSPSWDAATVFRGIFFGQGPVAARIPAHYFPGVKPASPEQRRAVDRLMAQVEHRHPGTVGAVAAAIDSGSPQRTREAIRAAAAHLNEVVKSSGAAEALVNPNCAAMIAGAFYFVVVYFAMFRYYDVDWGSVGASSNRTLENERFVVDVLNGLGK